MERRNQNPLFPRKSCVQLSHSGTPHDTRKLNSTHELRRTNTLAKETSLRKVATKTTTMMTSTQMTTTSDELEMKKCKMNLKKMGNNRDNDVSETSNALPTGKSSYSSSTSTPRYPVERTTSDITAHNTLNNELTKCKQELDVYNNATRDLEQQYMKINVQLGELQQKHARFIADRHAEASEPSRTGSEFSLKRKYTQIFHRGKSFLSMTSKKAEAKNLSNQTEALISEALMESQANDQNSCNKQKQQQQDSTSLDLKYSQQQDESQGCTSIRSHFSSKSHSDYEKSNVMLFETPTASSESFTKAPNAPNVDDIYQTLKNAFVFSSQEQAQQQKLASSPIALSGVEHAAYHVKDLEQIIASLQEEQQRFRDVILQQQSCLQQYHSRFAKAQHVMQSQQLEIEKLTISNKDLQDGVTLGVDQLRQKLEAKLREMGPISQKLREEQIKYERVAKENFALVDRINRYKAQAKELKLKIEDVTKRKANILNRLKNAERDLKVFRNYNCTLKNEKRKLTDEIQKLRDQLENLQAANKRMLARQRELNDKHCRDLQKRVYELEQRLGRSNNSTSNLLQERDQLISELQKQLNTLVHNFEISQKHIRILRRHIHTASLGNGSTPPATGGILKQKTH